MIPRFNNNRGFTLMELLVAMTLTSIIAVTIAISFSMSIRAWERGDETTLIDQNARVILDKISSEVASLYFYRYEKKSLNSMGSEEKKDTKRELAFDGTRNTLKFTSSTKLADPEEQSSGFKLVSIFVSDIDAKKGRSIYITEKMLDFIDPMKEDIDGNVNEEFGDRVSDLSFRYFLVKKSTNALGKTQILPGYWSDFYKEEENNHLEEGIRTVTTLRGIEVSLTLFGADDNGNINESEVVRFPALVIPVRSENVIAIEKPNEPISTLE